MQPSFDRTLCMFTCKLKTGSTMSCEAQSLGCCEVSPALACWESILFPEEAFGTLRERESQIQGPGEQPAAAARGPFWLGCSYPFLLRGSHLLGRTVQSAGCSTGCARSCPAAAGRPAGKLACGPVCPAGQKKQHASGHV
ncbi:hypothetical protein DUNSADRAFT_4919 [Dunaliella salina]|uniref:Encoded protein n=1 Tax=Dunaliella salina TaxID=3046 RepID=A0ABQ7GR00_DUNSA|nr:hypothetical protein DUNSADRAFT_4919 [Dunaliella salina]|eukprot:KAF5837039.1 hypothetical protein DUNSADRAFT_4919 [Dunaliella salina]